MNKIAIAKWEALTDRQPEYAIVGEVDLVVVRFDDTVSVVYGRCLHRGALMSDGHVDANDNLICGVHNWDYRLDSGVSEYENSEALPKFQAWIEGGEVLVDAGTQPGVSSVDIDVSDVENARRRIPSLRQEIQFEGPR